MLMVDSKARMCRRLVMTMGVLGLLACQASHPTCPVEYFKQQCADRAALWRALGSSEERVAKGLPGDDGGGPPSSCPSKSALQFSMVRGFYVGLKGGDFESEPVASGDRCCYTTRSVPCK